MRRDNQEHRIGRSSERHAAGDIVVVRTVTNGKIRWAAPAIVVSDTDETTIYYRPPGTKNKVTRGARTSGRRERELALRSELLRGEWDLVDHQTSGTGTLVINRSRDWFSVWLTPESHTGDFVPTYVNIETPQVRTPLGFDVDDLCLDLVISPNLEWQVKDADDLEARAEAGIYTPDEVRVVRAAAATAIVRVETRQLPFDGLRASWRPTLLGTYRFFRRTGRSTRCNVVFRCCSRPRRTQRRDEDQKSGNRPFPRGCGPSSRWFA